MAPVLIIVLVGWIVFVAVGAAVAQAKGRTVTIGAAIGFGAGLCGLLLGVFGLAIGVAVLLVFAVAPGARQPSSY